ncbi:MAG: hypothetical protein LLG03_02145 [Planctomycetaceae bacterium]|nr:hypothetical protein [Planctomycetaceae bacterium]
MGVIIAGGFVGEFFGGLAAWAYIPVGRTTAEGNVAYTFCADLGQAGGLAAGVFWSWCVIWRKLPPCRTRAGRGGLYGVYAGIIATLILHLPLMIAFWSEVWGFILFIPIGMVVGAIVGLICGSICQYSLRAAAPDAAKDSSP